MVDGINEGLKEGTWDGTRVGATEGFRVGCRVVGIEVGRVVGGKCGDNLVGVRLGTVDGRLVGEIDGSRVGARVGLRDVVVAAHLLTGVYKSNGEPAALIGTEYQIKETPFKSNAAFEPIVMRAGVVGECIQLALAVSFLVNTFGGEFLRYWFLVDVVEVEDDDRIQRMKRNTLLRVTLGEVMYQPNTESIE